jgi:hypothetical protein
MTVPGAADPRRRPRTGSFGVLSLLVAVAAAVMACSAVSTTTTPSVGPSQGGPDPQATPWPLAVVSKTIALAAADSQFEQVSSDLTAAVDAGDMAHLLTVTNDVLDFLTADQKNISALQGYPATKAVGDQVAAGYAQMIAGIKQVHDALVAGDGRGVTAGFATFQAGSATYGAVRTQLGDLANQAVFMTKHYNL